MPGHRRGRSLSEGLMLEESEKGGLVVSSVIGGSSGNQGLKEGDEIVGATINFDQLSKDDVLKILKLMDDNGFDEKVQVLTKNNLSKSMGTLDSIKAPEEMLKDSYNRLYNAKINRFMKDDSPGQPAGAGERGSHNGQVKGKGPRPLWGKPKVKGDLKPPVLTMDYPVVETHKVDAPTYLESPDLKFSAQKLKVPKLDVKGAVPDARGGELSLPNTNISTSDLSLPHLNGSLNIDAPSVNLERPYLETDIDAIDAPEFDMSLPKDDLKGPDLDLKVIDPLPKVRGDINVPEAELNLPEGVVTGPTLNINTPKLDNERTGKMFKMPKFGPSVNVPSLEVGTPNMRIPDKDMPGVNLKGPQLDLQAPDVNLKGPNLDLQAPDVSMMNMPSSKIRVRSSKKLKNPNLDVDDPSGYFELPKVRLSRRVPKGPDLDIDAVLKTQDMHLKTSLIGAPDLNVPDVDLPSVDIKGSKIDLELPGANIGIPSGKIKTPSLGMPDFDISGPRVRTPDLDRSADEMCLSDVCLPDLSTPDIGITSGKFKLTKPHAELKAPDFNVDAPSGKLKMPKFGFSGLKRPDLGIDADVKTPKLSLKAPKIKGGLDAPDLDLPKVDLKSPKLDANTPDIDIDAPSGKFKVPTFKMPKCTLSGPSIDGELDGPDLSLSSSKLKQPDVDVGSPSGKFKMPIFKMPDFGFSGPDVQVPDFEVKNPNLDLSAPKFKGGISHPDLDLPDVDLKGPKLDLNAPDVNFNMPSGKVKVPTLKKPKVDLNAPDLDIDGPSGNLKMPKFGLSGKMPKSPKFNLKAPKMKGGINFPDADLKSAKLDMTAPDLDINAPSGKFKMPKFRGLKGPNVDINGAIEGPDLNLSSPKLKGPKAHLNIPGADIDSPSGKFKMPTFKMPHLGLSGLKVKGPDLDLSAPKFKGGISHPDLDLPDVDLKGPKLDLNAPDVNFNMPSGKVKVPTLKKPKVDLNAPDLDIDGPSGHLKMPKFGLSGKMPKSPKLNLKAPKMKGGIDFPDLILPDADLKAAKLDMTAPDLDINAPSGKFKMPKLRGLKGPNVDINGAIEGPDMNLSSPKLKGPKADLNIPDADIDSPSGKFKMPTFKMPDLGLSGPKVKGPDLDLSAPRFKGGISHPDLDLPDVDLKGPKLDLNAPDVNFNMPSGKVEVPTLKKPKVDLNAPDLDIDDPSGHLKMPKFGLSGKMPKFTKMNLKAPKLKGGIDSPDMNVPDADLKAPKLDVNTPDLYINAPSGKFKMRKFKMPKFRGLKRPDVDIDGDLDGPEKDINAPTANLKGPKTGLKMPDLKMPDFGISGPNVDAPDYDLPDIDLSAPKLKGGISPPDLRLPKDHLRGPKLDLNAPDMPSGRFRVPTIERQNGSIKTPGFDISTPTFKMPEMPKFMLSRPKRPDQDISADIGLKLSKMKGGIGSPDLDLPTVDLEAPKIDVDTPDMNIDSPSGNFKMPHLKMPKFSLSGLNGPDAGIDGDIDGPDLSLSAPQVNTGIGSPDLDINVPSGNLNGPQADLNLPDSDIAIQSRKFELQSFKLPQFGSPNLRAGTDMDFMKTHDISPPKAKVDLKAPDLKVSHPDVSLSLPKADIRGPEYKVSSHSKRRSDIPGVAHLKLQAMDIDTEETLPHTDRKSRKVKGRVSYPIADIDLPKVEYEASGLELRGSDLNDPTGKLKIPKSKTKLGSHTRIPDLDVDSSLASINASVPKLPQPGYGVEVSQTDLNLSRTDLKGNKHHRKASAGETGRTKRRSPKQSEIVMSMPNCTHGSNPKMSEDQEGYFVTAFPKHVKGDVPDGTGSLKNRHKEESNRRSQTLRSLDFSASNVDLEVPEDENLKGSTFWLSKLI
ncbi:neuroblast differentiation-associated protein AHNAK-like [Oncorhynchus clarkii lewisi]|uniref:neuroblast differentiation-associated protein AHNAK-like n=1 Tax=Oncorhynchus clarkii lewisi TaxID=490388 RepID=UPI0039B83D49